MILNLVKLPSTLKSIKNKKQGREGLMANIIVYNTSIRLIITGAFNAFNGLKTLTGNDYSLKNNVILDSSFTCNIRNARSRFNLQSFRPSREDKENAIYINNALILIESYSIMSVTI
jgi:hypothetical protein